MKSLIKKYTAKGLLSLAFALPLACGVMTSCSDDHMAEVNTDDSKSETIDPNNQLTTVLLQTYGDFSLMDTYRSYITGFTQHFAGAWNVTNYAGSVHANDDQSRLLWDRYYSVAIKNLVDAINTTQESQPALNAALRIHRVYLMSVLTDTYGDIPCSEAGLGYIKGISNPVYDKQEDIYNAFFTELKACVDQLDNANDRITGDVTSLKGDRQAWQRYANSLRLRFAMRISDVNPEKAQKEFEAALNDPHGYIADASQNAYVIYANEPFTLYKGAEEYDFRVNALGEILYGQDPTSPTFISSTFFDLMQQTGDPRLYRICRHYINTKRSEISPDREGNHDLTDEVVAYLKRSNTAEAPCDPGAAWWNNWINAPANSEIPTLDKMVKDDPAAGYDQSNFNARMMRPALNIDFEMPDRPGILITSAEVDFLKAEAKTKGWNVSSDAEQLYEDGVRASMKMLNDYYLTTSEKISDEEISKFIAANPLGNNPKENINTQAWILHMMNPAEAWANLRRSDYPVLKDRSKLAKFESDFTYDDKNLTTPVRLKYPILESKYNSKHYDEALQRMGGDDDWHHRLWWDTKDINVK